MIQGSFILNTSINDKIEPMGAEFYYQGKIIGNKYHKRYGLGHGSSKEIFKRPGRSKVIVGVDEFGNTAYRRLRGAKFDASSLHTLTRKTVDLFEKAGARNSYSSEIHKRTVIYGHEFERRNFRSKKVKGFMFPSTSREVAHERKKNDLRRELKEAGINEHQLFLLMHSSPHSQTHFEKELPRRPLAPWKKGGMFPQEAKEIARQRRKNQRALARSGNIFQYHR